MSVASVTSLLDSLGRNAAGYDYDANRLRTDHAAKLREIAANRVARSEGLADSFSGQGLVHSGVHLENQQRIGSQADSRRAEVDQRLSDRLTAMARKRIQEETAFNVNNLIPR